MLLLWQLLQQQQQQQQQQHMCSGASPLSSFGLAPEFAATGQIGGGGGGGGGFSTLNRGRRRRRTQRILGQRTHTRFPYALFFKKSTPRFISAWAAWFCPSWSRTDLTMAHFATFCALSATYIFFPAHWKAAHYAQQAAQAARVLKLYTGLKSKGGGRGGGGAEGARSLLFPPSVKATSGGPGALVRIAARAAAFLNSFSSLVWANTC